MVDSSPAPAPLGLLDDPERLLTASELAAVARVPLRTVRGWSSRGGGPRRLSVGRYVRYRAGDVAEWLATRYID